MSSYSSDDENLELLKEAQDSQFLQENLYSEKKDFIKPETQNIPASLRQKEDENEQFNNFKITPECQEYIAKHLCLLLDKKLENEFKYATDDTEVKSKRKKIGGVKLFSKSEKPIKIEKLPSNIVALTFKPVNRTVTKYSAPVNLDDLRAITVSGKDILLQKDIKHWSNRTKSSKFFQYKQTNNGTLELQEQPFK
uniref:Protein CUSTOS n=1 Tax=Diabrotica virgifera virgifera TaxID=50390 RepID=A0A6P7F842_DIAVI